MDEKILGLDPGEEVRNALDQVGLLKNAVTELETQFYLYKR